MRPSNKTDMAGSALVEFAPAKVNLTLHVLARRADGYHELDTLVAFARIGDALTLHPGGPLALTVRGPTAAAAGPEADNLVTKAARALADRIEKLTLGRFDLDKHLPVAAGLGGGSSDAAAALRLLARANALALDDPRLGDAARATGADMPMCLDPRPRRATGIGEILSAPIDLPELPAVLVNPGVALPTRDVFARLALDGSAPAALEPALAPGGIAAPALIAMLAACRNDLEKPAVALAPVVADVLAALRALPDCRLARMSGSGPTCFALFHSTHAAAAAARTLRAAHPAWWVRETVLGGVRSSD